MALWSADAAVRFLAYLVVLGWMLGSYLAKPGLLRIRTPRVGDLETRWTRADVMGHRKGASASVRYMPMAAS